jgi:hypothetical protein
MFINAIPNLIQAAFGKRRYMLFFKLNIPKIEPRKKGVLACVSQRKSAEQRVKSGVHGAGYKEFKFVICHK